MPHLAFCLFICIIFIVQEVSFAYAGFTNYMYLRLHCHIDNIRYQ